MSGIEDLMYVCKKMNLNESVDESGTKINSIVITKNENNSISSEGDTAPLDHE